MTNPVDETRRAAPEPRPGREEAPAGAQASPGEGAQASPGEGAAKSVGEERVLLALAETVAPVEPLDLEPSSTPDGGGAPAGSGGGEATNRYTEHALIGRGGLGEVMEAFDQDLRRCVALKRVRGDRQGAAAVSSLVREAQVTAQLDHPNIPAVHTLGIDDQGRPFFTMTRLQGETLGELLRRRKTDPELRRQVGRGRLLRVFAQVAYAVAFAHDRGVLHRDLKPDNIMLGQFGEVRLMDWGIAKLLRRSGSEADAWPEHHRIAGEAPTHTEPVDTSAPAAETRAGTFTGTPGYASPEQVEGRPDIDRRADVYSLGALLYEILAGRPPVSRDKVSEAIADTVAGRIEPIRGRVPVSEPLAAIVHKALALDPADRYDTVLELIDDLEAMQEGHTISALQECGIVRAGRWYMARSPRIARLRNVDVDLLCWSSFLYGVTTAALAAFLDLPWLPHLWWLYGGVAALFLLPPLYTLLRRERPDDPGALLALTEGMTSSHGSRPRPTGPDPHGGPTPEETAPTEAAPRE